MGASIAFHLAQRKPGSIIVLDKDYAGHGASVCPAPVFRNFQGYGRYGMTPDSRPPRREIPGVDGLFVCAGFSGMGFKISRAIGVVMSELLLDGCGKTVDIRHFRLGRLPRGFLSSRNTSTKRLGLRCRRPGGQVDRLS